MCVCVRKERERERGNCSLHWIGNELIKLVVADLEKFSPFDPCVFKISYVNFPSEYHTLFLAMGCMSIHSALVSIDSNMSYI